MKDVAFTSYAFGPLYCLQQERLRRSILKVYPDANIRFWHNEDPGSKDLCMVPGARTHHESQYGWKAHCVRNCQEEGFRYVVFLDAAMVLEGPIDGVLEKASELGVLATNEQVKLSEKISDACLTHVGYSREDADALTLVGGSVYAFDFSSSTGRQVFSEWLAMEAAGVFGSEQDARDPGWNGHRCDEACMSLAMDVHDVLPQGFDVVGYHNLGHTRDGSHRPLTFYKLHFKDVAQVHGHSLNQSLLPLHGNILDLGCRGFKFTEFFRKNEYNVMPVDCDDLDRGDYFQAAVAGESGRTVAIIRDRDPDATRIVEAPVGMKTATVEDLRERFGVDQWDLIKMDIEGSEYEILRNAEHPMAGQITVEFHAHCGQTKEQLDGLLDMLQEHYFIYNREWKEGHGTGMPNYWDVLLVAKEWECF